jgi:hypothetical protein
MRKLFGKGTPRGLQGRLCNLFSPSGALRSLFSGPAMLLMKLNPEMPLPTTIQMISIAA